MMAKFTLNVMRKQLPIGQNIKFRCILTNYMQLLALKVARFISLVLLADKYVINAQLKHVSTTPAKLNNKIQVKRPRM